LKQLKQEVVRAESKCCNETMCKYYVCSNHRKGKIEQLKNEKRATKKKLDDETQRVTHLQGVVSELHEKFRQRDELETIRRLESEITELEAQIKQQEEELAQSRAETEAIKSEEHEHHEKVDEGIQVDIPSPPALLVETTPRATEEGGKSDEDEEEEFVYQGVDAPAEATSVDKEVEESSAPGKGEPEAIEAKPSSINEVSETLE
jgi:chromosome segregation ATPase